MNIWASDKEPFEGYVILEMLGHRRLVGFVREVELAGAGFLRIDTLDGEGNPAKTSLVPPASVYCITPITEDVARRMSMATLAAMLPPTGRLYVDDGGDNYREPEDIFDPDEEE